MEAKIQELQKELELVKRERDAAKSLCEMVQRHYMELLQKTMSFSAVQPTPQVSPLVEPLPGTAPADASSARTSVKRPAGAYPHPAKRVTSTVTAHPLWLLHRQKKPVPLQVGDRTALGQRHRQTRHVPSHCMANTML